MTPGEAMRRRAQPVRRWLASFPDRCPACGFAVDVQGHEEHCPHGPRAWMALTPQGWVHNPKG